MVRRILISAGFVLCAGLAAPAEQEQELPTADSEESFDIEPPLLVPYQPPEAKKAAEAEPSPPPTVEQLTRDFERAKRNAISAERLYRMGALAKVEAEQKALRVVRIQAQLENARLTEVKEQSSQAQTQKSVIQNTPEGKLDSSKDAELAKAIEAAHAAAKKRDDAELAAAEADVERKRKLLSLGSGSKSAVAKAQRKLEELKAARN